MFLKRLHKELGVVKTGTFYERASEFVSLRKNYGLQDESETLDEDKILEFFQEIGNPLDAHLGYSADVSSFTLS